MDAFDVGQTLLGKYEITGVLGEGGMGRVLAARDLALGRLVALKILLPKLAAHRESVERFEREARTCVRLKNPHVATVYGVESVDGVPFILMEHLVGEDVAALLARPGTMGVTEAADLLLQGCEAIHEAHSQGIVHRDLKPANLFVITGPDGRPFVKVLDFGISKTLDADGPLRTASRDVLGSPYYMSPEQLAASRVVDARTDVWSLGVVLFEMLCDTVPFPGATVAEVHAAILRGDDVRLSEHMADAPPALEELVSLALVRDRERRLPSVAAFAARLAPFGTDIARESLARLERVVAHAQGQESLALAPPSNGSELPRSARPTLGVDAPLAPVTPVTHAEAAPLRRRWKAVAGAAAVSVVALAGLLLSPPRSPVPSGSVVAATPCPGGATAACEADCAAHAPGACEALAVGLEQGHGAPRDLRRATALYEAACGEGAPSACNGAGALYARGAGVKEDQAKAFELYTRACTGKFGRGCVNLGAMHFGGTFVAKNEALGAKLFQRGCELGEPAGCYDLGVAYHTGRGVPKSAPRWLAMSAAACDAGGGRRFGDGCLVPAVAEIAGDGVPKDVEAGLRDLTALCAEKVPEACLKLGSLYAKGSPEVAADPAAAAQYQSAACHLDAGVACAAKDTNEAVDRSNNLAAQRSALMAQMCDAGSLVSCDTLGWTLLTGIEGTLNRPSGLRLLGGACEGGVSHACGVLKEAGAR